MAVLGVLVWLGAAACTELPTGTEEAATGQLGSQGGKVELVGSATLEVAVGALTSSVDVRMAAVEAPVALPATAVSKVVELTPHGTGFSVPARVTLRYSSNAPVERLRVLRLADAASQSWEPVGGVRFDNGRATFETTTFSYYTVTDGYACEATPVSTGPGCNGACGADAFCSSSNECVPVARATLCDNAHLTLLLGQLPPLDLVAPQQNAGRISVNAIAAALAEQCGMTPSVVSQAEPGILDACTDAPLLGSGNTMVVVGGSFGQRMAAWMARELAPVFIDYDDATKRGAFRTRDGTVALSFEGAQLTDTHDYFFISLVVEPTRGALVLSVEGMGWEGTPAATWYLLHRLLPELRSGARTWPQALVVEWTDDGDGVKDEGDTYRVAYEQ